MMTIFHRYALLLATACCVLGGSGALAQAYPNKPIKLLVGFPPGGGTDLLARLVAQQLAPKLGQPVVVDNRPGANTIIATEATAKSAADGYTLAMAATGNVANPSLYSKLPYDPYRDFTWITQLTEASLVLVAGPTVQANSMKELITLAKARPGQISYASAGVGSSVHLAGVMLERMAGVQMLHVAYKGSGPALNALLSLCTLCSLSATTLEVECPICIRNKKTCESLNTLYALNGECSSYGCVTSHIKAVFDFKVFIDRGHSVSLFPQKVTEQLFCYL